MLPRPPTARGRTQTVHGGMVPAQHDADVAAPGTRPRGPRPVGDRRPGVGPGAGDLPFRDAASPPGPAGATASVVPAGRDGGCGAGQGTARRALPLAAFLLPGPAARRPAYSRRRFPTGRRRRRDIPPRSRCGPGPVRSSCAPCTPRRRGGGCGSPGPRGTGGATGRVRRFRPTRAAAFVGWRHGPQPTPHHRPAVPCARAPRLLLIPPSDPRRAVPVRPPGGRTAPVPSASPPRESSPRSPRPQRTVRAPARAVLRAKGRP